MVEDNILNLTTCCLIRCRDGTVYGFTQCDRNLVIEGVVYYANIQFTRSAVEASALLSPDNLVLSGVIDEELITSADLLSGKFDYAELVFFLVDAEHIDKGKINLRLGYLGEISLDERRFSIEVNGLIQTYARQICGLYSPQCRATLGDKYCKVNIKILAYKGKVEKSTARDVVIFENPGNVDGYYQYGVLKFLTGKNAAVSGEVMSHIGNKLILTEKVARRISKGDLFTLTPGCDGELSTCITKFNNAINFRGEPFLQHGSKILF